jgi:hypothetical protein
MGGPFWESLENPDWENPDPGSCNPLGTDPKTPTRKPRKTPT